MQDKYYDLIFKRKSFHRFRGVGDEPLTPSALADLEQAYRGFEPLYPDIRTAIRVVPAKGIRPDVGAEYCVLIYSEQKENYLMNVGYIGQQLDFYLVDHGIGSLWCGLGKPDERSFDGLDFVIMFGIRKVGDETKFRNDRSETKRNPVSDFWSGDGPDVAEASRFAPSACNSQPWYVESADGTLTVFRYKKPGKIGFMPPSAASYFNRIDIGIYLCVLEICMTKRKIAFSRELFSDDGVLREKTKVATYRLGCVRR